MTDQTVEETIEVGIPEDERESTIAGLNQQLREFRKALTTCSDVIDALTRNQKLVYEKVESFEKALNKIVMMK